MAKENILDGVKEGIIERIGWLKEELGTQYKGIKPFNKEAPDIREVYMSYKSITPEYLNGFVQKYGRESVNSFLYEMYQYEQKLNKRG